MGEVYISVDVEAAGPVPAIYSMLAIGACVLGKPEKTFYAEFRPINSNSIPEAMEVVGRSLNDFEHAGRDPKEAMAAFRDWIILVAGTDRPVFVGFNASFDWAFVNFYFETYLGQNPFGIGGLDIKSFYMGMSGCNWDDTRSSRIPDDLKGLRSHTHNALDDAIEQGEMFSRMLGKASDRA